MSEPMNDAVAMVFAGYPPAAKARLGEIRELIFEMAAAEGVGPLTETLKWGEPAYLTEASRAGSTIRLGWKAAAPGKVAIYLNCKTGLIESLRAALGDDAPTFEGNRALLVELAKPLPAEAVKLCLASALTYRRDKQSARKRRSA